MVENSKLVMTFTNRIGKNVTLSIDDPRDDLTEEQIKAAIELIIKKIFSRKTITRLWRQSMHRLLIHKQTITT